ncbi:C3a anaphylatoxin chemotactic receptor-like [Trichomycterus rosablanca]|uniref:C3a anaphylatoxin chemotactic receptor-like n=1 Tax=Trichomycterus rosablanca TaxID=2290929 RepID=UPI002F35D422
MESGQKAGLTFKQIIILIIYIVVFVLGTVGNALVIFVTGYKMKRTVNSIWFLNLALADFLFMSFLILNIISISQNYNWPFGLFMCKSNTLISVLNMFASIFLLATISLDRCLLTWLTVWTQNHRTPFKAWITCLFIWVAAVAFSIPFATYREVVVKQITFCGTIAPKSVKITLAMLRFTVGFLIPFIVIICSYIAIGVKVLRLQRDKKLRPFKIILTVILAFFLCWLPFHIQQLSLVLGKWNEDKAKALASATPFTVILAYLNSCLNPILYMFMCDQFKTKLRQSLLLVLENAFAEEHFSFLSHRHSISSHHTENQTETKTKIITVFPVTPLDGTTSTEN